MDALSHDCISWILGFHALTEIVALRRTSKNVCTCAQTALHRLECVSGISRRHRRRVLRIITRECPNLRELKCNCGDRNDMAGRSEEQQVCVNVWCNVDELIFIYDHFMI